MGELAARAATVARNLRYRPAGAVRELTAIVANSLRSRTDPDPVVDADWDLLVVLDACRADLLAEVIQARGGDHDGLGVGGTDLVRETRTSPASATPEWLERTFGAASADRLAEIAYVTGNPFSDSLLDGDRLHVLVEPWRTDWDDRLGTVPPRPVTDAAVRTGRETDAERLVVHYMQPHFPALDPEAGVPDGDGTGGVTLEAFGDEEMSVWDDLRFGRRSVEAAWAAYRDNAERVLADVDLLLRSVDAERAVVTADHGNAFGEHGLYGHPGGVDVPVLREVPWYVTTATDTGAYEPAGRPGTATGGGADHTDSTVDDRLEDLGYRT